MSQTTNKSAFWNFDISFWFKELNSSSTGITHQKAQEILRNTTPKKKHKSDFEKKFMLFIGQFKSPLMLLLIGAAIISAFLGDTSDVFIILFIVLSTGIMSFVQEHNAESVVRKLQSMITLKSSVFRDNVLQEILSSEIVPGDVIEIKTGDIIPADCLLIECNELQMNESSLTGESFPVAKRLGIVEANAEISKRSNAVWEGTNIVSGKGIALVINIGNATVFGNIVENTTIVKPTVFEKGIKDFGFLLMKITLLLSSFILVVNIVNHKSIIESALFALALAVGMAPELLPAITTIAMSAGAKRMLAKKVIVKKLASIQNLGEINLLCTDKTGTITEGNISIVSILNGLGAICDYTKSLAVWNASLESGYSNPIDNSLRELKLESDILPTKIGEIPYDFNRKQISIGIDTGSEQLLISKGAFSQIIERCTNIRLQDGSNAPIESYLTQINELYTDFGTRGYRVIGISYKNISSNNVITKNDECSMVFAGFILLEDPVKAGIQEAIESLSKLNIGLKIITGDNKNIALTIAKRIGIENPIVITGAELEATSSAELENSVTTVHIFAEVEPLEKDKIIRLLQKNYAVGYMGDGINDVAAINAADVGISVENAVDVAREAADFVLLEKDLNVLVEGIKEGRKTFANTLKYIFINTGSTFGNMFSVAIASLILPFLPMLPKQILLTNFITDFPYLSVASDNVDEEQLKNPGKWDLKLIQKYMIIFGLHSSIFDVLTFLILYYVLKVKESAFQTCWFIESILTELFILFIIRTHKNFFKSTPSKYLLYLSLLGLILTLTLPFMPFAQEVGLSPIPLKNLMIMLAIVATYIITADLLKVWFFKKYK